MRNLFSKLVLACAAVAALFVGVESALADNFLFQWDDRTEGHLIGNTYNGSGTLIQSVDVGPEGYSGVYGLGWNAGAFLVADVDVSFG